MHISDIPRLSCPRCKAKMLVDLRQKNYTWVCESCNAEIPVFRVVPSYKDAGFAYDGLAVHD